MFEKHLNLLTDPQGSNTGIQFIRPTGPAGLEKLLKGFIIPFFLNVYSYIFYLVTDL